MNVREFIEESGWETNSNEKNGYNGWNTYETWLFNVEVGYESLQETVEEWWDLLKDNDYDSPQDVANELYLKVREEIQTLIEFIEEETNTTGIARSLLRSGLRAIDINELAREYCRTCAEDKDESLWQPSTPLSQTNAHLKLIK